MRRGGGVTLRLIKYDMFIIFTDFILVYEKEHQYAMRFWHGFLSFLLEFHQWEVYTYPTSHKKMQACMNALLSILMVARELKDS